jgi:parallel beta-helix repeat protein
MPRDTRLIGLISLSAGLLTFAVFAQAREIEGRITTPLTLTESSVLVGDVTCAVENASCIVLGAPGLTLDLAGYAITGLADAATACSGGGNAAENGVDVVGQNGAVIRGPGVVRQMRGFGIRLLNSTGGKVSGITASTNCFAGIFLNASSGVEVEGNVAVRNGHNVSPCGGI